jgi:molecular chaperone DnaK
VAELGDDVPDEWLDHAQREHSLRLTRPRVVVTVPAYFHNNQKNATRDAGGIAGVEVVRLLHEPTAACLAVHRQRRLEEQVLVVDLGAGTLDLSHVEVGDNVYEVRAVDGDTELGGADFDRVVQTALEEKATAAGVAVTPSVRRRIAVAAEQLRIRLSSQEEADYQLRGLDSGADFTLTLSRAELTTLLSAAFARLTATCERFRRSLSTVDAAEASLVLVGGPFLAPHTRKVAEEALGMSAVGVTDPALAVAHGAALQGAVLSGDLREVLLLDVTPLPLGIRVVGEEKDGAFAELIAANTTIPFQRTEAFTTAHDNQPSVRIEVLQGSVAADALIGEFVLENIPPAPTGEPRIEVTFAIDANCVLEVTARNAQTGAANSVRITDTTLLRPQERQRMTEVLHHRRRREETRHRLRELLDGVDLLVDDGDALVREWRTRLGTHRATTADPDPRVRDLFTAMYRDGADVETELPHLELTLRDLADRGRATVARAIDDAAAEEEENLADQLDTHARRHRELQETVARWNAVLVASSGIADPHSDLVRWHDAGDHVRALDALERLEPTRRGSEVVRRWLDCLAHLGEHQQYEAILYRHAADLGLPDGPAEHPQRFLDAVLPSIVRTVDGSGPRAAGFLFARDVVVVGQHPGDGSPNTAALTLGSGLPLLAGPTRRHHDRFAVVPLRSPVPAPTLRAGYGQLLRIGDPVFVLALRPGEPTLAIGVIQRVDPASARIEATFVADDVDGLAFTARGEVVGTSAPASSNGTATIATFDGLPDLIAATGHNPWVG